MKWLPRIALITSVMLSSLAFALSLTTYLKTKTARETFRSKLINHARQCLYFDSSLKGKEEVLTLLHMLEKEESIVESGSDDLRVKYVFSQGCIEHVLACFQALGDITDLIGMIHTPLPATPLCTSAETLDQTLLDASIRYNLEKLLTVSSRAHTVREYLKKGGTLYIIYPQGGLEKRSAEQQQIYKGELALYPNHLVDWVLSTQEIDPDMIGATYFFKNTSNQLYLFSIKARQANDPQSLSEWGLWLGEITSPIIKKRVETLFNYYKTCNGPDKSLFTLL